MAQPVVGPNPIISRQPLIAAPSVMAPVTMPQQGLPVVQHIGPLQGQENAPSRRQNATKPAAAAGIVRAVQSASAAAKNAKSTEEPVKPVVTRNRCTRRSKVPVPTVQKSATGKAAPAREVSGLK